MHFNFDEFLESKKTEISSMPSFQAIDRERATNTLLNFHTNVRNFILRPSSEANCIVCSYLHYTRKINHLLIRVTTKGYIVDVLDYEVDPSILKTYMYPNLKDPTTLKTYTYPTLAEFLIKFQPLDMNERERAALLLQIPADLTPHQTSQSPVILHAQGSSSLPELKLQAISTEQMPSQSMYSGFFFHDLRQQASVSALPISKVVDFLNEVHAPKITEGSETFQCTWRQKRLFSKGPPSVVCIGPSKLYMSLQAMHLHPTLGVKVERALRTQFSLAANHAGFDDTFIKEFNKFLISAENKREGCYHYFANESFVIKIFQLIMRRKSASEVKKNAMTLSLGARSHSFFNKLPIVLLRKIAGLTATGAHTQKDAEEIAALYLKNARSSN